MSAHQELVREYSAGADLVRKALEGIGREQLLARPQPGKWSTLEVLCHLADAELIYADRIKRVLAEDRPTFFAMDPDRFAQRLGYDRRRAVDEMQTIEGIRASMTRILSELSEDDFARQGVHSEDGPVTLETLLRRVTNHVPHHVRFVEEKRRLLGL